MSTKRPVFYIGDNPKNIINFSKNNTCISNGTGTGTGNGNGTCEENKIQLPLQLVKHLVTLPNINISPLSVNLCNIDVSISTQKPQNSYMKPSASHAPLQSPSSTITTATRTMETPMAKQKYHERELNCHEFLLKILIENIW